MRWLKVSWHHDLPDEPVLRYSEIDAGLEFRKVEIYRDGRVGWADMSRATGSTALSGKLMPTAEDLGDTGEFTAWPVDATEFEQVWRAATGSFLSRFAARFGVSHRGPAGVPWAHGGVTALVEIFGGATFGDGLYRVHTPASAGEATELVAEAFPDYRSRLGACFGFDWLGRQFALDLAEPDAPDPPVLLFEPGTGEVLEIPVPFSHLHDNELVDYADAALATDFFEVWRETGGGTPTHPQCVGYRIPLFLGGEDEVGNLEMCDWRVYWSVTGQLRTQLLRP